MNSWFETGLMGQTGCQAIAFCDANGKMICCQEIYKTDTIGNTAHMNMWVGGNNPRIVKTYTFEPCHRKDANPYSQTYGRKRHDETWRENTFFLEGQLSGIYSSRIKRCESGNSEIVFGTVGKSKYRKSACHQKLFPRHLREN